MSFDTCPICHFDCTRIGAQSLHLPKPRPIDVWLECGRCGFAVSSAMYAIHHCKPKTDPPGD